MNLVRALACLVLNLSCPLLMLGQARPGLVLFSEGNNLVSKRALLKEGAIVKAGDVITMSDSSSVMLIDYSGKVTEFEGKGTIKVIKERKRQISSPSIEKLVQRLSRQDTIGIVYTDRPSIQKVFPIVDDIILDDRLCFVFSKPQGDLTAWKFHLEYKDGNKRKYSWNITSTEFGIQLEPSSSERANLKNTRVAVGFVSNQAGVFSKQFLVRIPIGFEPHLSKECQRSAADELMLASFLEGMTYFKEAATHYQRAAAMDKRFEKYFHLFESRAVFYLR